MEDLKKLENINEIKEIRKTRKAIETKAIEKDKEKLKEKLKIERKFNELANHLCIKLSNDLKKLFSIAKSTNNGKNLKIEPIDSSLKDKRIAYCDELPFGILSSCYINIETMNIFF